MSEWRGAPDSSAPAEILSHSPDTALPLFSSSSASPQPRSAVTEPETLQSLELLQDVQLCARAIGKNNVHTFVHVIGAYLGFILNKIRLLLL